MEGTRLARALEQSHESFTEETERLLVRAFELGLISFCCHAHAENAALVVHGIESRN